MRAMGAFLVACSFVAMAAPSSAALVTKHFRFTADFTAVADAPVDSVSGEIKVTFDNAANIMGSEAFTFTGFNLAQSNAPDFSYNASTNLLMFGSSTTPWAYGTRRTHNDFGFGYNVATNSIPTFGFTNSTGAFFLSRNVSVQAVPEPATWAMMIGGFGLAGMAMRRRRAVSTVFA